MTKLTRAQILRLIRLAELASYRGN